MTPFLPGSDLCYGKSPTLSYDFSVFYAGKLFTDASCSVNTFSTLTAPLPHSPEKETAFGHIFRERNRVGPFGGSFKVQTFTGIQPISKALSGKHANWLFSRLGVGNAVWLASRAPTKIRSTRLTLIQSPSFIDIIGEVRMCLGAADERIQHQDRTVTQHQVNTELPNYRPSDPPKQRSPTSPTPTLILLAQGACASMTESASLARPSRHFHPSQDQVLIK
ncbi:uncharacterized protein LACBIDRAFT_327713 [Laccaria bicolor S238N-H82]|uniref:Predicted protein n=1 Tax=Laccaria bicolor (strain S238N-H82 / ATCC MYA-4686) TaxID=486041 RepID=B0DCM5_LACBS|nr:uncharacterized protein LACBIDRAFT_327713 [Laccaria bicolor S238N-H82]EDR07757.1 predicted protein [Laccaria bicolor S238N-H82]|eukprot:XP_001881546.1 predicted protein [Laccaria bicolor S238N-H82]